jgi:ribosomal protein S18 acetylase RimI-like enzyme
VDFEIRQALLDDTSAISALFRARIDVWQRMNPDGRVENVPYESLGLYERWLHGGVAGSGAWMSVETAAIHLNHLLLGGGFPIVAVRNGEVMGYAEAYAGVEHPPLGGVMHLAHLAVHPDAIQLGVDDLVIDHVVAQGKALKCQHVTLARAGDDPLTTAAERRYHLNVVTCVRRYTIPARTGQVFYRAVDHTDANPALINGWVMSVGRLTSARHLWEMLMPRIWETIPEMRARTTHRMHFSAAGQDAYVLCQQGLYNPRSADVYVWTPKPITAQHIASIKDWAHREGYRALSMVVGDEVAKTLGSDAEPEGYTQETCALDVL